MIYLLSAAGVGGGLQVELLDNASVLNLYNNIVYNTPAEIYTLTTTSTTILPGQPYCS